MGSDVIRYSAGGSHSGPLVVTDAMRWDVTRCREFMSFLSLPRSPGAAGPFPPSINTEVESGAHSTQLLVDRRQLKDVSDRSLNIGSECV